MKGVVVVLLVFLLGGFSQGEQWVGDVKFHKRLSDAKMEYRKDLAGRILKADRVVVSAVNLETEVSDTADPFESYNEPREIGEGHEVFVEKVLTKEAVDPLVKALGLSLSMPDLNTYGFDDFCPVHFVQIYEKKELLFEGYCCLWNRVIFFEDPSGIEFCKMHKELETLLVEAVPVPKQQLLKVKENYPDLLREEDFKTKRFLPSSRLAEYSYGSNSNFELVKRATKVEVCRISIKGEKWGVDRLEDLVGGPSLELKGEGLVRLRSLLVDLPLGSVFSVSGCRPKPGVRIKFQEEEDVIDLLWCFECSILIVYKNGQLEGGANFFEINDEMLSLVKKWFPEDAAIQKLK